MSAQTAMDFMVTHEMTESDCKVWSALRTNHEGAARAIQVDTLAELVGIGSRQVQRIVRRLITLHGKPVGTSMRAPFGYFVAITREEREQVAALHTARALSELAVASKIKGVTVAEEIQRLREMATA